MEVLGIDVGGTGIKGNIVNTITGEIIGEKFKLKTPSPTTPEAILESLQLVVDNFNWKGKRVGIGFPSVIKNGISLTASNIGDEFINFPISATFSKGLECDVTVVNDADSAGIAEITYGKGKNVKGLVLFITLGTGIGSSMFLNGKLIPNTELGHLFYKKSIFERYASNYARESKGLSWKAWGKEVNKYLNHLYLLLSPDLILIGGGVSKHFESYRQHIDVETIVDTADLLNDAGIVGAAMSAANSH